MVTPKNEIVITDTAVQKVIANDEMMKLKCIVESLHEKVLQLTEQISNCEGDCQKEKEDA
jgi:hypothetical protein|tara:strand:- start:762 stop:941 length:180 start_codon:yes stop_codon:yes gene_type:complete